MRKINEIILYSILIFLIVYSSYFVPRMLIILATPFVYTPQTFNESITVEVTTFDLFEKVVIRANVSDAEGNQQATWFNLTASNGTLIYENKQMVNTTLSCGTNCWIWEENYTLAGGDPYGTWIINVTANDTAGNLDSNSTTFDVNQYISITISDALTEGVRFGHVNTNTEDNPALNNTGCSDTCYNVTLSDTSNVNADFWHYATDLTSDSSSIKIENVTEESSNTSASTGFSLPTVLTPSYTVMGNSTVNCTNMDPGDTCWIKYYLDVPLVPDGDYETTYYICVNSTAGTTVC